MSATTITTEEAFALMKRIPAIIGADDSHHAGIPHHPLLDVVFAVREFAQADADMRRYVNNVQSILDRVNKYLDAGYGLNDLGELQRTAQDFDRQCAIREERARRVRSLVEQLIRYEVATADQCAALLEGTPFAREDGTR